METQDEDIKPKQLTEVEKEKAKKTRELEKYWRPVKANPMDFTGWTYLLQYVEQEVISHRASILLKQRLDQAFACTVYIFWQPNGISCINMWLDSQNEAKDSII